MSKRSQSRTPISLFSFQDIITSVCGIMVLLVLLFAIEVARRSEESPGSQDGENNKQPEIDRIEEQIKETEKLKHDRIKELLGRNAGSNYILLEGELSELTSQIEFLSAANHALVDAYENLVDYLNGVKQEAQRNKQVSSVKFIQGKSDKKPLLVECSYKSIVLKGMKGKAEETFKIDEQRRFNEYLENNVNKSMYCLVVMIKPSSIGYSYKLANSIQSQGYTVGWDALEESVRLRVEE